MSFLKKVVILSFALSLGMLGHQVPAYAQFLFMKNQLIGKKAPEFTLDTIKEKNVKMSDYREGDKAIVFFWATWCPHCREQLKKLNDEAAQYKSKNIKIILVDVGEQSPIVESYAKKNNLQFNVFLDVESKVAEDYEIIGVPTMFVVGEDGVIKNVIYSLKEDIDQIFAQK